ncbi:hypothetical protein ACFS4T_16365 [Pseudomonas lini]
MKAPETGPNGLLPQDMWRPFFLTTATIYQEKNSDFGFPVDFVKSYALLSLFFWNLMAAAALKKMQNMSYRKIREKNK